ncbi:hypothetical protein [Sphingomicrobium astaxanthinifaciens]|uniref:hypothetical protein n=1 Tax=Sphingomicrobium astaxanthinifaciens TaxID=1227949 RepID=UPI001FCC18B2|nr:hypothetical protein [Sphingomicrobium astaxanthinifaciens]MCJ7420997.1 hypothetical protein [Sphingomicrobium astaxanthinifaciens]
MVLIARQLAPLLGAAALLVGCGETSTVEDSEITVRSEAQTRMFELSPVNRDIALKRAIRASGLRCERVTRSGYVADYENLMMWTASCDDGRDWAIFIGADDSAQVRNCVDVAEQGLPACEISRADSEGQNTPQLGEVEPGSNEP